MYLKRPQPNASSLQVRLVNTNGHYGLSVRFVGLNRGMLLAPSGTRPVLNIRSLHLAFLEQVNQSSNSGNGECFKYYRARLDAKKREHLLKGYSITANELVESTHMSNRPWLNVFLLQCPVTLIKCGFLLLNIFFISSPSCMQQYLNFNPAPPKTLILYPSHRSYYLRTSIQFTYA